MHGAVMPCPQMSLLGSKMSLFVKNLLERFGSVSAPGSTSVHLGQGVKGIVHGVDSDPIGNKGLPPRGPAPGPALNPRFSTHFTQGQGNSQLCSQQLRELSAILSECHTQLAPGVMGLLYTACPAPIRDSPER